MLFKQAYSFSISMHLQVPVTTVLCHWHRTGLGPKYSVLRYFGTRVPILQYSSVLGTRTFKKYLYSYLYSSTFKNKSTFNEYLRVLYEY